MLSCFPCLNFSGYYCLLILCIGCMSCCGGYSKYISSHSTLSWYFYSMELCFWFEIAYDWNLEAPFYSYEVRPPIPSSLFIGFVFFLLRNNTAKFSLLNQSWKNGEKWVIVLFNTISLIVLVAQKTLSSSFKNNTYGLHSPFVSNIGAFLCYVLFIVRPKN